jgi:hypothetical protein
MSVPATLIKISTGEVLKRQLLPGNPNEPIPGLDPDLEWLIDYEPFGPPLYDSRVYTLQTTMDAMAEAHPEYPLYNQYLITYDTIRRAVEEVKEHVINRERTELGRHVDYVQKLTVLGLAIIFRQLDGLQLTPTEQAIRNRIMRNAQKLFTNHQRRRQLEQEAEQLQPLDIDAGWADPDEDEPV